MAEPAYRAHGAARLGPSHARHSRVRRSLGACVAAITLAALSMPAAAGTTLTRHERSEPHMGTLARLVVYAPSARDADEAARAAFARIAELDAILSDYRADSELMRLGARAGQGPVAVSPDLFAVLAASQSLAVHSGGTFDVTSGPLTRLWRGARRLGELPSPERVSAALALTGHQRLVLNPRVRTATLTTPGMRLDVGGIAKGYAVDEALRVLRDRGVPRSLAALGGDIAAGDPPPGTDGWSIDIEHLANTDAPRLGPIRLARAAMSTAGDGEQWMTVDGTRYSHILDPRTGRPMTGRSSTTVVASSGLVADGLDTAVAVLGPRAGLDLVESTAGAAAVWVVEEEAGHARVSRSSRWPPPETDSRATAP